MSSHLGVFEHQCLFTQCQQSLSTQCQQNLRSARPSGCIPVRTRICMVFWCILFMQHWKGPPTFQQLVQHYKLLAGSRWKHFPLRHKLDIAPIDGRHCLFLLPLWRTQHLPDLTIGLQDLLLVMMQLQVNTNSQISLATHCLPKLPNEHCFCENMVMGQGLAQENISRSILKLFPAQNLFPWYSRSRCDAFVSWTPNIYVT